MNIVINQRQYPGAQRGLISLPLAAYVALGMGAVILALGVALKVQSMRLDASQQKNEALAQQVQQWVSAAKQCDEATSKAVKEATRRATAAQVALEAARKGVGAKDAEIARLRAFKASGGCPAGAAVAEIRKGLGK